MKRPSERGKIKKMNCHSERAQARRNPKRFLTSVRNDNENGNVIVIILIAIILFGAITFVFTQNNRGAASMMSSAQADAYATEIIAYGNEVKQTVKRLLLRGCQDTEISFENNTESGYTNGTDTNCQIFHINGGGRQWENPPTGSNDGSPYIFMGNTRIDDIGNTTASELALFLPNVTTQVCAAINDRLELSIAPNPANGLGSQTNVKFTGAYASTNVLGTTTTAHTGKSSFCYIESGTGDLFYVHTLLPR